MIRLLADSTLSRHLAVQSAMERLQKRLSEAQSELATGRLEDVTRSLGHRTRDVISIRQVLTQIEATAASNNIVSARLDATQAALGTIGASADGFLQALVAAIGNPSARGTLEISASDGIDRLVDVLAARMGDVHLFSGINSDVAPMAQYYTDPPPASRAAFEAAFTAHFGFQLSDPAAAGITASSMQAFLDTGFSNLFDDTNWAASWSTASDDPMRARVSRDAEIEASVTANDESLRKLTGAYVIVSEAAGSALGEAAFQVVVADAAKRAGEAVAGLTRTRGVAGTMQIRVTNAIESGDVQADILTRSMSELEAVDTVELSARLVGLMNQIEATYAITARLQQLSLLNEI